MQEVAGKNMRICSFMSSSRGGIPPLPNTSMRAARFAVRARVALNFAEISENAAHAQCALCVPRTLRRAAMCTVLTTHVHVLRIVGASGTAVSQLTFAAYCPHAVHSSAGMYDFRL